MNRKQSRFFALMAVLALAITLTGCVTTQQQTTSEVDQKLADLNQQQQQLAQQKEALDARESELAQKEQDLSEKMVTVQKAAAQAEAQPGDIDAPLLPPNAIPGECYARVFIPPVYEATTETVLKKAKSERIEVIPATYMMVDKEVLVREASEKLVTIPAQYGYETKQVEVRAAKLVWKTALADGSPRASDVLLATAKDHGIDLDSAQPGDCFHEHYLPPVFETEVKEELVAEESYKIEVVPAQYEMVAEEVLVSEASQKLVQVPVTYKWVEEKMLVKEAHTTWKKGRGLIERIDNTTGEIMCLVEIPAEYKIVKKRVVDQPAHTVTETIPAVYKSVKVRKMVAPASERKVKIPARYKQIKQQNSFKTVGSSGTKSTIWNIPGILVRVTKSVWWKYPLSIAKPRKRWL